VRPLSPLSLIACPAPRLTAPPPLAVIVKASSGPRYVVGCRSAVPKDKLKNGVRVSLDMTTLTIMRCVPSSHSSLVARRARLTLSLSTLARSILPTEVDPLVYNMTMEDPSGASFGGVGGLGDQIRELREVRLAFLLCLALSQPESSPDPHPLTQVIELPLMNPELFMRVGIKPPKGASLVLAARTARTLERLTLSLSVSQVSSSTALLVRARRSSPRRSRRRCRPTSSRSSRRPSSTSTSASRRA